MTTRTATRPQSHKQQAAYGIRIPPDLKRRIEQAAEQDRRPMSAEFLVLWEEALAARDRQEEASQQHRQAS